MNGKISTASETDFSQLIEMRNEAVKFLEENPSMRETPKGRGKENVIMNVDYIAKKFIAKCIVSRLGIEPIEFNDHESLNRYIKKPRGNI